MLKNVFFKPIKEKVELPEEVENKVEEVDKILTPVEDAPAVEELGVEPMKEVPTVENTEEPKEFVEEQIEAKDDLTGGVATPNDDGSQTSPAPEVFEEKEVEEPVATGQLNVIKEQLVPETITEAAQAKYAEEIQVVLGENKEAEYPEEDKVEDHVVAITEEKDMMEVEVDGAFAAKIHQIIQENTEDAVKKILKLITEAISGK